MTSKIRKIVSGTGLIAAAYFVSRFLGLIRDMVIAWKFGAQSSTDIYNASFLIPDALNYMLAGGAFSIVLIPMLSKYVTESVPPRLDDRGQEIFRAIFTPVTLLIVVLTGLTIVVTPWISALIYPEFAANPESFNRLVRLTRLILPAQIFFIAGGLINATLRARGDFRGNVWGPNLYNLGIILGGATLGGLIGIEGLSIGVLAGAFFGPFFICWLMARHTITYSLSVNFKSPDFREFIRLNLPLMVGVSLLTVDQLFIRYFGAKQGISAGTISCLTNSRNIMMVPIALVGQAAGQVSLTYLSQLWHQEKKEEYFRMFSQTMQGVMFLSFIFAGGLFVVAPSLVNLLFFHGAFTVENSQLTAQLLRYMVFAVPPFAALQILVNGYYVRKNTLRPMIISSLATIVSFFIYDIFRLKMAGTGIALATAVCFWFLFVFTLSDYFRKYCKGEPFKLSKLMITTTKALIATTIAITATLTVFHFIHPETLVSGKVLSALLTIGMMSVFYMVVVVGVSFGFGGDESRILRELIQKILNRLRRK